MSLTPSYGDISIAKAKDSAIWKAIVKNVGDVDCLMKCSASYLISNTRVRNGVLDAGCRILLDLCFPHGKEMFLLLPFGLGNHPSLPL